LDSWHWAGYCKIGIQSVGIRSVGIMPLYRLKSPLTQWSIRYQETNGLRSVYRLVKVAGKTEKLVKPTQEQILKKSLKNRLERRVTIAYVPRYIHTLRVKV
jgi:hypothetical protein